MSDLAVTLLEVKEYLRVGFDDDDTLIENLLQTADSYLVGSIGTNVDKTDNRAKLLVKIYVKDMYDNRGRESENPSANLRKMVSDLSMQLKIESHEVIE